MLYFVLHSALGARLLESVYETVVNGLEDDTHAKTPSRKELNQVLNCLFCGLASLRANSGIRYSRRRNWPIDRVACLVRCSFSIRAKRTKPSPIGPKPTPGETATSAFSIRSFENSSDPRA
jgi:hypothetical protein